MTETAEDTRGGDDGRMTLIEHLTELRRRLIISFSAIGIGAVVCWFAYPWIIDFLLEPYCQSLPDAERNTDAVTAVFGSGDGCFLVARSPLEQFNVRLTVAGYGGVIVAIPVVLWQVWRFVAPGLYAHEKRYAVPFMVSGVALFFLGAALAYWSIPRALEFLSDLGGDDIVELFAPKEYLGFVIKMIVAFGVAFEFPIALIFLQLLGLVENRQLRRIRQYAIVGIVAFVAVITPSGDPFTLMVLSIPMYVFYEIAIVFGRIRNRRARKAATAA